MVIIDVGACVGEYTDYCLKAYDVDMIIMVEPLAANVEHLEKKYKDLLGKKVFIIAGAISDYSGMGELYPKIKAKRLPAVFESVRIKDELWFADNDPGEGIPYSLPFEVAVKHREELGLSYKEEINGLRNAGDYAGNAGSVLNMTANETAINNDFKNSFYMKQICQAVGVTTIDQILKSNNIEHVDILKLDVEGCEYNILKDIFANRTYKNIDKILFEDHSEKREGLLELRESIFLKIKETSTEDKFWLQEDHLTYDVPLVETDMWKAIL